MKIVTRQTLAFAAAAVVASVPAWSAAKKVSPKHTNAAHAGSVKPAKGDGTLGTTQVAGGDGVFGQTYTLVGDGDYGPINFRLKSAEYSVERFNMAPGSTYAPKANEKLLVIHYSIKNPNKEDFYYTRRPLFQTVTTNDTTGEDIADSRRESEKAPVAYSIKPGQGIGDLVTYAVIPADGALPKLILQLGRIGTKDHVMRYMLGTGSNIVLPLPAPYADPAQKDGATALAKIPATVGTTYVAGYFDIVVNSLSTAAGPFGDLTAEDGKQFFVANVTLTNRAWDKIYVKEPLSIALKTDDDKVTEFTVLHGKTDSTYEGNQLDPGDSVTLRFVCQIAKTVKPSTISIAESEDNSGSLSKAFEYTVAP